MNVTGETINVCIGKTNRKRDYPDHSTLISPLLDPKLSRQCFSETELMRFPISVSKVFFLNF